MNLENMKKSSVKAEGGKKRSRYVPVQIVEDLFLEAGFRCAIPACGETSALDKAHLKDFADGGPNSFENLLVLCSTCHRRLDDKNEKHITKKQMRRVKNNLKIINGRYSLFELRLLHYFLDNDKDEILLFGRELDVSFLIKDGLLEESSKRMANSINFPPKRYFLTGDGKKFIQRWKGNEEL